MKGRRRSHYLELAKQGGEEKMECNHSWKLHENGSNGILELRGRRRWFQILIWRSRSGGMQEEQGGGRRTFTPAEFL